MTDEKKDVLTIELTQAKLLEVLLHAATREDIAELRKETNANIAQLRNEVNANIGELRN